MPGITPTTAPTEVTFTLREPPFTYFHLQLVTLNHPSRSQPTQLTLDKITLRQYVTLALTQCLGFTGAAVPIDILKVDGKDSWIRVGREDSDVLAAALSQWSSPGRESSLRVVGRASWLGGLHHDIEARQRSERLWTLEV